MRARDPSVFMWGDALDLLERADRLHRQFFQLRPARLSCPAWEPPVDIFETERQFVVVIALPGVTPDQLEIESAGGTLVVRGTRRQPAAAASGAIHRLELPYGHFERRIELPAHRLQLGERSLADGCLTLTLDKLDGPQ